jgi:hypothetical protein
MHKIRFGLFIGRNALFGTGLFELCVMIFFNTNFIEFYELHELLFDREKIRVIRKIR